MLGFVEIFFGMLRHIFRKHKEFRVVEIIVGYLGKKLNGSALFVNYNVQIPPWPGVGFGRKSNRFSMQGAVNRLQNRRRSPRRHQPRETWDTSSFSG